MEIHQPDHRISSFKDFAIHILIVTVGILIAIGLEQVSEALHHRHLAHRALESFHAEIKQNREKVSQVLEINNKVHAFLVQVLAEKERLQKGDISGVQANGVSPAFTTLRSSSWETAVSTQAVLYLPYDEAERLAGIYHVQRQFDELESKDQQLWFDIAGFRGDPSKLAPAESAMAFRELTTALAYSEAVDALGQKLLKQYDEAGKGN